VVGLAQEEKSGGGQAITVTDMSAE